MGWNTTVVICNDQLHDIERDPEFGKKLVAAITAQTLYGKPKDGPHGTLVVEQRHADGMMVVAVGGNGGYVLGYGGSWDATTERLLKTLAESKGYRLRKKPCKSVIHR